MTLTVAFLAGLLFFFSPCVWPLYPAYLTYLGGSAGLTLEGAAPIEANRKRLLWNALGFILGFSLIFVVLGATASAVGQLLLSYQELLRRISGILIAAFGLIMLGWLRLDFLNRDLHIQWQPTRPNFFASLFMGFAFGFGWTPCVGPILAAILLYAGTMETLGQGVQLLSAYSLGFAVPFAVLAIGFERLMPLFRRIAPSLPLINKISGVIMVILGIMVYTNALQMIATYLYYAFE